jgi:hypothetical protein
MTCACTNAVVRRVRDGTEPRAFGAELTGRLLFVTAGFT